MRLPTSLLLVLTAIVHVSSAQSMDKRSGNWIGVVTPGNSPIYFRITGDSAHGYTADWNIPTQKVIGFPCKSVIARPDSLIIEMGRVHAIYRGKYLPDGTIRG